MPKKHHAIFRYCSIGVVLFFNGACHAADTTSFKYPHAILVQLNTEQSRISLMKKTGKPADAAEVAHDAKMVQEKMIADFTANLHYCPVYYFMDTNTVQVQAKKFDGVLMDASGKILKSIPFNSKSTDYAIVYFGHYVSQPKHARVVKDSTAYTYDPEVPPGKGLVVLNDKFQQISYMCYLGYYQASGNREFSYTSKKYDIQYFPMVKTLEQRLNDKRRKKAKNHYWIKPALY